MIRKLKNKKKKLKINKTYIILGVVLLALLAGFFVYKYFVKPNNYLVQNKYYGFKLQTPKGWIGEEKIIYSEDNIAKILAECKKNKKANEVGAFRFKSQRYPEGLASLANSFSSGIILEITISCGNVEWTQLYKDPFKDKIGGEVAYEYEEISDIAGLGNAKAIWFWHNNLLYNITEYIHISPSYKLSDQDLRGKYEKVANQIISSIKFIR